MPSGPASPANRHTPLWGGQSVELERLRRLIARVASPAVQAPAQRASLLHELIGPIQPKRLVDLLGRRPGDGAWLVGLCLAAQAMRRRGQLVVVDPAGTFYSPAAIAWGVDARRLLLVRPRSERDALAAAEIALRSPAVGAVWASLGRVDGRSFQRLLLAAESGETFGVLTRDACHEPDPSWAHVQLCVEPMPSPDAPFLVRLKRLRNRHGPAGGEAMLSVDWRTGDLLEATCRDANQTPHPLPVAAQLAGATRRA